MFVTDESRYAVACTPGIPVTEIPAGIGADIVHTLEEFTEGKEKKEVYYVSDMKQQSQYINMFKEPMWNQAYYIQLNNTDPSYLSRCR